MAGFWETLEDLFRDELAAADRAGAELDTARLRSHTARQAKPVSREDVSMARWAERGVEAELDECFRILGRAIWSFHRAHLKEKPDRIESKE